MRFTELLKSKKEYTTSSGKYKMAQVSDLGDLGGLSFSPGKTDKNVIRTPHYEFNKLAEMFETNPLVSSGVSQFVDLLIPNQRIKFYSKDKKTIEMLKEWHKPKKGFIQRIKTIAKNRMIFGNAPLQKIKKGGKLVNVFDYSDMTRIYVNPDDVDGKKAYLLQVPFGMQRFKFSGKVKIPEYHRLGYIKNYMYKQLNVYGVWISSQELVILKTGWSRDLLYGRSQLASAIDAHNIIIQILSTWDTVAKTRQLDQTIVTPVDYTTGEALTLNPKAKKQIMDSLEDDSSSYKFIPMPVKFATEDIKTSGKYDLMDRALDILRKMVTMSLLPQFLTPWSDTATTQGAEASMPPFIARLRSIQAEIITFLNEEIIDELREDNPDIAEDATYVFDDPVLNLRDYMSTMENMLRNKVVTPVEYIEVLRQKDMMRGIDYDTIIKRLKKEEKERENNPNTNSGRGGMF